MNEQELRNAISRGIQESHRYKGNTNFPTQPVLLLLGILLFFIAAAIK